MSLNCNDLINRFLAAVRRGTSYADAYEDVFTFIDGLLEELLDASLSKAAAAVTTMGSWWCTIDPRALAQA